MAARVEKRCKLPRATIDHEDEPQISYRALGLNDPQPHMFRNREGITIMFLCEDRIQTSTFNRWLAEASGAEKESRIHGRRPYTRPIQVFDGTREIPSVYCRDISDTGIGLLSFEEITSDRIKVRVPAGGKPISLPCDVRWRRQYASDLHLAGCSFDESVLTTVRQVMLRSTWSEVERRIQKRYPFFRPVCIRKWSDVVTSKIVEGFVLDIGDGGLGFLMREPLDVDKLIHVDIDGLADSFNNALRVRIKWCQLFAPGLYRCGGIPVDLAMETLPQR